MSNWNCKECQYTDLECNEQCKEEKTECAECGADEFEIFAFGGEKIATVKGCCGCEICDERSKDNESRSDRC